VSDNRPIMDKKFLLLRANTKDSLAMRVIIPHCYCTLGASRGAGADGKLADSVRWDISEAGSDCGVITLAPSSRLITGNGDIANSL
jgi:hypothetical protein